MNHEELNTTKIMKALPALLLLASVPRGSHAARFYGVGDGGATRNLNAAESQQRRRLDQKFCEQCIWKNNDVCEYRAHFLLGTYDDVTSIEGARQKILDAGEAQCASDDGEPPEDKLVERVVNLELFCKRCMWKASGFDCEKRMGHLTSVYKLSEDKAMSGLMEQGHCIDPSANTTDVYIDNPNLQSGGVDGTTGVESIVRFCGACAYRQSGTSCEEKAQSLSDQNDVLTLEAARISILSDCAIPDAESEVGALQGDEEEDGGLSTGAISGIVVAIILLLVVTGLVVWVRKKKIESEEEEEAIQAAEKEMDAENPGDAPVVVAQAVPVPAKEEEEAQPPPPECAPKEEVVWRPGHDPPALNDDDRSAAHYDAEERSPEAALKSMDSDLASGGDGVEGSRDPPDPSEETVTKGVVEEKERIARGDPPEVCEDNAKASTAEESEFAAPKSATEDGGAAADEAAEGTKPNPADDDIVDSQETADVSMEEIDESRGDAAVAHNEEDAEETAAKKEEPAATTMGDVSGPADDAAIDSIVAPPRPLTPEELEELASLIRSSLNLGKTSYSIQAQEDADMLVDYAIDLIDRVGSGDVEEDDLAVGSTIGRVIEELGFLEMEICGPENLEEMRIVLGKFLGGLGGRDPSD